MTEEVDRDGRSALHHAAFHNDLTSAKRLLDEGADVNLSDRIGLTPLHMAAQQWAIETAAELLAGGAEIESTNKYGNTPLFVAVSASKGRGEMIELLRSHGADPLHVNNAGQTPVGYARLVANYDIAQYFKDVAE